MWMILNFFDVEIFIELGIYYFCFIYFFNNDSDLFFLRLYFINDMIK